ncbi:unnamed protein product [Urochloa decumbens]|uniref:MATH domain-containing protein n=1 Tax=Urochloa decumbens TaxID=240449 RepID=A0ABC9C6P9_9POAL
MSPDVAPLPLPSASSISATATSGVHVVKLSGYSHAKRLLGTGECVESAMFRAAGQFWRVKVYPNGSREKCGPGAIALFLSLVGGKYKGDVRAMFQFSLVRHGSKLLASAPDGGRAPKVPVTFNAEERNWGFENDCLGGKLEDPEYLKDDAILIRCDITVLAVEQHDLDALDLLCDCDNDGRLCEKLHAHDGNNTKKKKKKKASQSSAAMRPSASTIAVTASAGCHVVKLSGYSQTNLIPGNGKHMNSAFFWEAGHVWRIRCYPDGDREETAGHVSLYLELAGEYSTNVHAEFQFSLVPHGQLTTAPRGGGTRRGRWTFGNKYVGNSRGFKDFMAREKLEKSEYLKDDCFCVRCDVTAMNKPVAKLRGPEKLELLCHCNDELCESIHGPRKMEPPKAETLDKPRRFLGLKKMLLSCIPIRAKTSQQQQPVFDVEYSRL